MMFVTAVDQYKCPATSAVTPMGLSSSARLSRPVENTPNQPRSRSTLGSAATAPLHHRSATEITARAHLARTREPPRALRTRERASLRPLRLSCAPRANPFAIAHLSLA